jgi:Taurine catabolism dioxygenase TauD, TfdA family
VIAQTLTDAAWRSHQLQADEGWIFQLSAEDCADIDRALRVMQSSGLSALQLTAAHFPLGGLAEKVQELRGAIEAGPGVALLRGLPVDRYSREDCARIFFGLGLHLGHAMAQNPRGDMLGHVRDEGRDWKLDPTARAYQTAGWLPFHTDPGDVVALLCLRTAKEGGLSSIASAAAIHDFLADQHPDVLETLFGPFCWDSRGQEPPGERPWHAMPVFERGERGITSFFVREYIESAQRFDDAPRITTRQQRALAMLEALAVDDRFRVDMAFDPGDMQWVNNHVVLHSRTGFKDFDEPDRKRHLLRLWLKLPVYRHHPPGYSGFIARLEAWPKRDDVFRAP